MIKSIRSLSELRKCPARRTSSEERQGTVGCPTCLGTDCGVPQAVLCCGEQWLGTVDLTVILDAAASPLKPLFFHSVCNMDSGR